MRIVVLHNDVFIGVLEDWNWSAVARSFGYGRGLRVELQPYLLDVIVVDVAVANGPDEFADRQAGLSTSVW